MTRTPLAAAAVASAVVVLAACSRPADPPATAPATSATAAGASPAGTPSTAAARPAATAGRPRPALVVTTVRPTRTVIADALVAHGSVAAWQEALVGAEIGGLRIVELRADVGQTVRAGELLAVLQDDTVRVELAAAQAAQAEAQAGLAEARAAAAEARANAERARQVESTGALSAQQVAQFLTAEQTAQARVELAEARVTAARAQSDSAALRLRQTRVRAPDGGIVSARPATVGAVVPAGQELFRLVLRGRIEWRAELPSSELDRVRPGQRVVVRPAAGEPTAGTVRMLGPVVDAQTRNARVYVDLPAGSARPGMFAQGEFELGSSTALTVPQSAVVLRDGFAYVFRVEAGRVVQQKVRTGRRTGERIEVLEGLDPDTPLVERGGGFLNDGDLVQVTSAGDGK
jgi:RND family efflux transporter MFP subunit